jgi:hypothetical protein
MRTLFGKLLSLKTEVADHVETNGRRRVGGTQLGDRAVKLSKTAHAMARRVTGMHPTAPIYPIEMLEEGAPFHKIFEETAARFTTIWLTGPRSSRQQAPAQVQVFPKEKFIALLPTAVAVQPAIDIAKKIAAAGRKLAADESFGSLANEKEIKVQLGDPVHVFALLLQTCQLGVRELQSRYPPLGRPHPKALVIPDLSIQIKVQDILRALVNPKKQAMFSDRQVTALAPKTMHTALKHMSDNVPPDVLLCTKKETLMKHVVIAAERLSIIPADASSEDDEEDSGEEDDSSGEEDDS